MIILLCGREGGRRRGPAEGIEVEEREREGRVLSHKAMILY